MVVLVSSMSTWKMAVVLALLSVQMMTLMMSSSVIVNASRWASTSSTHDVQDDETYEEVLDTSGEPILYGSPFTVWNVDTGIGYLRFSFGLGYTGDVVRTDTQLTMSGFGSTSGIYSCQSNGSMATIPISSEGTPQEALIRVRHNATDGYYRLQITEESTPVFVQFVYLSQGGLLCTRGAEGSRLRFQSTSSSSATSTATATATAEYSRPLLAASHSTMQIPGNILRTQVSSSN